MLRMFYGWSEQQLLEALIAVQTEVSAGVIITSTGTGDSSTGGQVATSPEVRLSQIQRGLFETDPDKYSIFSAAGQSRTVPSYNSGGRSF